MVAHSMSPKAWTDEDIDERVEEIRNETMFGTRWTLNPGSYNVTVSHTGHLVVMHASVVLEMLETIKKLKSE